MLRENCLYQPEADLQPVDQFGFVDLVKAHATGSIPADVSGSDPEYNGVEDPASLLPRATDAFDATRKAKSVVSARAAAAAEAAAANPQGDAE